MTRNDVILVTILVVCGMILLGNHASAQSKSAANETRLERCRAKCGQYKFYDVVIFAPEGEEEKSLCVSR